MMRTFVALILVTFTSSISLAMGAGHPTTKARVLTAAEIEARKIKALEAQYPGDELKFFYAIAGKAVRTIDISMKNAKQQYDCVVAYQKDPAVCPQGREILDITKQRYAEYRQAYALGHMKKINQYKTLPGTPPSDIVSSPYSGEYLDFAFNEVDWLNGQRQRDIERLQRLTGGCSLSEDDVNRFYQGRVSQIVTSTPVVLLIKVIQDDFWSMFKARKYLPEDQDVVLAYEKYMESLKTTRLSFTTELKADHLEGLIVYQMLASQVIQDDAKRWLPVFESLSKKLLPQTQLDFFLYWAKNTFFSLNTLFIGCSVISSAAMAVTGFVPFGIAAAACTTAAAGLAGMNVIQDIENEHKMQQEWLAGIRDRGAVESARMRLYVDLILLGFNLYALKAITPASVGLAPAAPSAEQIVAMAGAKANVSKEMMQTSMKEFVKEQGMDVVRTEFFGWGFGVAFRELIAAKEVDRVAQVSAEILFQYQKTGTYTFATQADVICKLQTIGSR